jgi:hypothetical protein
MPDGYPVQVNVEYVTRERRQRRARKAAPALPARRSCTDSGIGGIERDDLIGLPSTWVVARIAARTE